MKNRTMPSNTAGPQNGLERYIRFRHTKNYMRQRSAQNPDEIQLMKTCGYANLEKFRRHREQWDLLEKPVPKKYLEAINVRLEVLELTVEQDREEYEDTLNSPRQVSHFTVRLLPTVCKSVPFPEPLPEHLAIELLRDETDGLKRCLHYPDLKTVFIEGETIHSVYYAPSIEESCDRLTFSANGSTAHVTML